MVAIHSLSARVLLILGVALVPALTGAVWYLAGSERDMLLEQMRLRGQAIANALANSSLETATAKDYPGLEGAAQAAAEGDGEIVLVSFLQHGKQVARYPTSFPIGSYVTARATMIAGQGLPPVGEVEVWMSTEQTLLRIDERKVWAVVAMTAIFSLMAGVLHFFLYRTVVLPIRSLTDVAARIERGDLDVHVGTDGHGEVGSLARGLDRMAVALRARDQEINRAHDALEAKNQELQRRGREVARKNVELREANRVKDEFLATMSHELRTPLNSVLGFLALLKDGLYTNEEEQRGFLANAHVSANHLLKLVNDVLDFTRVQAGRLVLRSETCSVAALVEDVLREHEPFLVKKGLTLVGPIGLDDVPPVQGDRARIAQVLGHVLDNAIKFTPLGQVEIAVRHRPDQDGVEFMVRDTGIGMDSSFIEHAFELFRQADGSYSRRYGGLGLGLCMCKRLMELMGGTIAIESGGLEQGTTVSFVVPCAHEVAKLDGGTRRAAG